jgi:hypothetical protein
MPTNFTKSRLLANGLMQKSLKFWQLSQKIITISLYIRALIPITWERFVIRSIMVMVCLSIKLLILDFIKEIFKITPNMDKDWNISMGTCI